MLLSETVFTKWNSRTKKYYEDFGYVYTFMGDSLEVKVEHLKKSSMEIVLVRCDYCGIEMEMTFSNRNKKEDVDSPDACIHCVNKKASVTMLKRYGETNAFFIEEFREKAKATNIEKYGVENPFQSEEIKEKIIESNLKKYGKKNFTQTKEYIEKTKKTSISKYGKESWMLTDEAKQRFSGENSPVWKGGIHDERWDRVQPIYKKWRTSVFERDHFLCVCCDQHPTYLEAHHLVNWNTNIDERYNVNNGVTLCRKCHTNFHREYGKRNNTPEQFYEFVQKDKNVRRTKEN